ncbi:MAG: 3-deoxy-7-phosphoheptulonate synthase [Verrucomicrobiota bacterium]
MLIVMKSGAAPHEIDDVVRVIEKLGFRAHVMPGATRTAVGITGNPGTLEPARFEHMAGVSEAIRVTKPYKLITLDLQPDQTVVRVGDATIGGEELAIIAGPCAVESREQTFAVAEAVAASGARFLRGGAFKPRSSPYDFAGLGEEGLEILAKAREAFGLKIVTEALDENGVDLVEKYADMIQIGARNMQNFSLLRRVGKSKLPVLLKRGIAATIDEWLLAAEYIMSEGNYQVVLCERGVRTFTQHARNTLDLAAIPVIRRISHLPIVVDASHAAGKSALVRPLSRAGVAAGADGVMVEVHNNPDLALCDAAQAIMPEEYLAMVKELRGIHQLLAGSDAHNS